MLSALTHTRFLLINAFNTDEDQLHKCISENKILITFTNLEGALSLKLKGYNPIFVLVLPEDKLYYKKYISQSITDKCVNQINTLAENVKRNIFQS